MSECVQCAKCRRMVIKDKAVEKDGKTYCKECNEGKGLLKNE